VATIWSRKYIGSVSVIKHPEYLNFNEKQLVLQLLSDSEEAIRVNGNLNATRWRLCAVSIELSIAGAILLTWCIL
jgi:hypothetical protein